MDRLSARLQALADDDAARTDPTDATVERGWSRLCSALAVPIAAAPVGIASASASVKKIAGAIVLALLGVSAAAAPLAIERDEPIAVQPVTAEAPRALEPTHPRGAFVAARPPAPMAAIAEPEPAPASTSDRPRARVAVDPLVAELRTLATARARLDAGRHREALAAARKLLRSRDSQLLPEARAIEALAACALGLPRAPELASRYLQQHANSPHRKRVAAACRH